MRPVFALALTLFAGCVAASPMPKLGPDAKLLAFGDSLTDGVGGTGENYPQRLARHLDRIVVNEGLPGDTTADGRRRLPAALARHRPALLILCLGVNDLLRGVPPETMRENLIAMLAAAREAKVPVLLLAVPVPGSAQAHPLFAEVAELGDAMLDSQTMVGVLSNPALKADLVHANRDGYREIADQLAARLRPLLQ
ncbi:MAG: GDSL-type esterase/lipase family protein [Panacagrimonas sp.]